MNQKIFQDGITGKSIQFPYLQQMAAIIEVEQAIAGLNRTCTSKPLLHGY